MKLDGEVISTSGCSPLLISSAIMFHPARDVSSLRIMVSPMNLTALRAPNVLAIKADTVAFLKVIDTRRKIDVVHNKHRQTCRQSNDEPLMSASVIVVF